MAKTKTQTASIPAVQAIDPLSEANKTIAKLEAENSRFRSSLSALDVNKVKSDVASLRGDIKSKYGVKDGEITRASITKDKSTMRETIASDVSKLPEKARLALVHGNKVLNTLNTLIALVSPSEWKAKTSH